jgi:UDP-N-acetylglucosamine 2-epimerase (non-hydrolysing)
MEAGNRSFDSNVPEEINRKIVDVTADINIAYTEHARRYLIAEGHRDDSVLLSGSPLWEVLSYYQDKIETNSILTRLGLESNHYFLVSIHREENLDLKNNFKTILNALKVIQEKYLLRIIFSTHPRTKIKLEQSGEIGDYRDLIEFHEPFSYFEYIKLIKNTFCFISDSGTISEEAACLQVPAVCIRNSIERPEAIEHGNTVLSGLELKDITLSIDLARSLDRSVIPEAYKVEDVSDRILKMILSRYHTVNRRTWNK